MKKLLSGLSLVAILATAAPVVEAAGDGRHPYDYVYRNRRPNGYITNLYDPNYERFGEYWYQFMYPTRTHALLPEYRHTYYEQVPYVRVPGSRRLVADPFYLYSTPPQYDYVSPDCRNYTFNRPNYRVPPYKYECQR